MMFVTLIKVLPGKYLEAIKSLKQCKVPDGIEIKEFIGMFGKPDAIIIYDAKDEGTAADFAMQFGKCAEITTQLACPIEQLHWTSY